MRWKIWIRYRKKILVSIIAAICIVILMLIFLPKWIWFCVGAIGLMGIGFTILRN